MYLKKYQFFNVNLLKKYRNLCTEFQMYLLCVIYNIFQDSQ